jgi:hypothetical protein
LAREALGPLQLYGRFLEAKRLNGKIFSRLSSPVGSHRKKSLLMLASMAGVTKSWLNYQFRM